jgi:2-polyprenyl-6-methoxyphenol hydroxylase-like FAD-dependent oxidoreductase
VETENRPLIVGAGPVGLAATLFLAAEGINTRLVDMNQEPSRQSKALAVNPRTSEILEAVGLTQRMLAIGTKIRGDCLWRGDRLAAKIEFAGLKHKYPFMLALSHATTERLLQESLVAMGGTVERGSRLIDCKNEAGRVAATLDTPTGQEVCQSPWMLAADGAIATRASDWGSSFPARRFGTGGTWRTWPSTFLWPRIARTHFFLRRVSSDS